MCSDLYVLTDLDDDTLLLGLRRTTGESSRILAVLLAHIAEVDKRRLYLDAACSSMHAYCVQVLNFSEGGAYKRIHAARAARSHPVIFELVADGSLHLTAVTLLAPHLTAANHRELLDKAKRRSKRQIEEMIAALAPKPDLPPVIRKLPQPAPEPAPPATSSDLFAPAAAPAANSAASVSNPASSGPPGDVQNPPDLRRDQPQTSVDSHRLAPLSPERFKVQFTASRELCDKIRLAQDLLRHQIPGADLAEVCDRAFTVLLDQLMRKKFGLKAEATRPAKAEVQQDASSRSAPKSPSSSSTVQHPPSARRPPAQAGVSAHSEGNPRPSRHIPRAIRRAVLERDGLQCTFVDESGRRCNERACLEFQHDQAFAKFGKHEIDTIRLVCKWHNQHLANMEFGFEFMEAKRRRA
ncbi:MAG: hypothetical protein IT384_14690 [Deltaproteobacteria bacterium]|nr:hypothetical protein [Deltaproteobacteria bacterium]